MPAVSPAMTASLRSGLRRRQRARALGRLDRGAGALGDVLEAIALVVDLRRASAGRAGARGAVVLAGERNTVAFLHTGHLVSSHLVVGGKGAGGQDCEGGGCKSD